MTMAPVYRLLSNQGPFAQLLSTLLLMAALVLALFLGTFIFLAVLGVAVVLGIFLYLRFWWLRRRAGRMQRATPAADSRGGVTLEGEYTVEERRSRDDR